MIVLKSDNMLALLVFGLVVAASAAPHFSHNRHPPFHHDHHGPGRHHGPYFRDDDLFDTEKLWGDISRELAQIDKMLEDLSKTFPTSVSNAGVVGNEYQITIFLPGFEEKEIVVKARDGLLMIQAVHKATDGNERNYLDLRTLPSNVNVAGSWTYDKNTLKVVFPLTGKAVEGDEDTQTEISIIPTPAPDRSREEMEPNQGSQDQNVDVDVGAERGQVDLKRGANNEITEDEVEATTYAVDFNNEVEFVPVHYR